MTLAIYLVILTIPIGLQFVITITKNSQIVTNYRMICVISMETTVMLVIYKG